MGLFAHRSRAGLQSAMPHLSKKFWIVSSSSSPTDAIRVSASFLMPLNHPCWIPRTIATTNNPMIIPVQTFSNPFLLFISFTFLFSFAIFFFPLFHTRLSSFLHLFYTHTCFFFLLIELCLKI